MLEGTLGRAAHKKGHTRGRERAFVTPCDARSATWRTHAKCTSDMYDDWRAHFAHSTSNNTTNTNTDDKKGVKEQKTMQQYTQIFAVASSLDHAHDSADTESANRG